MARLAHVGDVRATDRHPSPDLSERLRHANTTITLDLYSHEVPSMHADAANEVAAFILGLTSLPGAARPPGLGRRRAHPWCRSVADQLADSLLPTRLRAGGKLVCLPDCVFGQGTNTANGTAAARSTVAIGLADAGRNHTATIRTASTRHGGPVMNNNQLMCPASHVSGRRRSQFASTRATAVPVSGEHTAVLAADPEGRGVRMKGALRRRLPRQRRPTRHIWWTRLPEAATHGSTSTFC